MWIWEADWPTQDFQRALRSGTLLPVRAGLAVSPGFPFTDSTRAAALAAALPRGAALTGAAALWVSGWRGNGPAPLLVTAALTRGMHPGRPPSYPGDWNWVTDDVGVRGSVEHAAAGFVPRLALVRCVPQADACATSLAHEPESQCLSASYWALTQGSATPADVRMRFARIAPRSARDRAGRLLTLLEGQLPQARSR